MNTEHPDEKRRYHRIFYHTPAQLNCNSETLACQLIDLSLKGCLLRFEAPWQGDLENLYTLTLQLSDEHAISMTLSVSHIVDDTVGFKCEHIDIDSISHLRRLVELNLGDSELLERDLLALAEQS
ncbi:MAG: PilZ domain-containing protein [Methylomicrobium sp.]